MNDPVIIRHVWLLFVIATVANAFILKFRSRVHIREHPELAAGYRRYFRGVLFWSNLPWLVMGVGIELGGVRNVSSYFRPRDGNPFVLAWFAVVVTLWILGFYWLFMRRGAEFLIEHPGLWQRDVKSPAMIRVFYCLMVAGGIFGLWFMLFNDIPEIIQ
jgi:hypothetical protein